MTKKCSRCKEIKPDLAFHKNRSRSDGLHHYCKKCRTIVNREKKFINEKLAYKKLLKKDEKIQNITSALTTKKCSKCNLVKPIRDFSFAKTRGYYRSICKKCCVIIEQKRVINKIREGLL